MKRANLVLDERLLSEATQVLAAKTYSAAVNIALEEVIRVRKIQSIPQYFGTGIWQGDLAQMRENCAAGASFRTQGPPSLHAGGGERRKPHRA